MLAKVDDIHKEAEKRRCPVQRGIFLMDEFLKGPMCGRCFPCAFGSYEALIRLKRIEAREGTEADMEALRRIAHEMRWASFCKKGKDVAEFFSEYLDSEDFREHLKGICSTGECRPYIRYKVIGDRCINCDECRRVCPDNAIIGQKRRSPYESGLLPYEIRDKRCSRCGRCFEVCPVGAIVVVQRKTGQVIKEKALEEKITV